MIARSLSFQPAGSPIPGGGGGGIRTHGPCYRITGFQGRLLRPLGHPSIVCSAYLCNVIFRPESEISEPIFNFTTMVVVEFFKIPYFMRVLEGFLLKRKQLSHVSESLNGLTVVLYSSFIQRVNNKFPIKPFQPHPFFEFIK